MIDQEDRLSESTIHWRFATVGSVWFTSNEHHDALKEFLGDLFTSLPLDVTA